VLTRQFRLPSFLNGNPDGMLIEVCAGMLDGDDPATCARREAVEETGYKVEEVQHAFDTYTSPGGVTELIHCFVAAYTPDMKVSKGGGLPEEGEKIELLEPTLDAALHMIDTGAIRMLKPSCCCNTQNCTTLYNCYDEILIDTCCRAVPLGHRR
jgi:GDP-mannose pyrophosphatase NudK